jgi:hypothetical protein
MTVISKGLAKDCGLLESPDLISGLNLKGRMYKNNPHTVEALENEITHVVASVTNVEHQEVLPNLFRLCDACLTAEGRQCQQFL